MDKQQKMLFSVVLFVTIAFSASAFPAHALIATSTLTIKGSSAVYPIAMEAGATFRDYWSGLVTANPSWGASQINTISIDGMGSGTVFSAILPTSGTATADIGEMSRPPTTGEWNQINAGNVQIWAVGVDSIANVYSPDMTWAPTNLNAVQVAKLFESADAAGTQPYYTTWGAFLTDYYGAGNIPAAAQAHMNDPIRRAVRDPTSGTYDCWNSFFGKQLGQSTERIDQNGYVVGSQYMAPYTQMTAQENYVDQISSASDTIAFVPTQIAFQNPTAMISIKIYNANPPTGFNPGYYAPTSYGITSGTYTAYRWLWEVTPSNISSTGENLVEGVWIAYMKLDADMVNNNPNFVSSNEYLAMPRAAMAGGQVVDSTLAVYTPRAGQTQVVPRLVVDSNDFFYFMDAYIGYYGSHTYNPYADIDANGVINGADFLGFMSDYVGYYTNYNLTP